MDFVKRKLLRRTAFASSEGDIVYQSWLLQLPPTRGLKKFLSRTHWRWVVLRYTAPQEGVMEVYTNASCSRLASKLRITRKYKVESGLSFNPGGATNQLNMFSIRTERQVHYLVAETQAEAEQWVLAICTTCGLDIPRQPKSPSPTEFLAERPSLRPRAKSESLPGKNQLSSSERRQFRNRDPNYILLSECYVPNERKNDSELTKEDIRLPDEGQAENLSLSNNNLSYDHPKPIHQRLRYLTSPDLRDLPHPPQATVYPKNNYSAECLDVDHETDGLPASGNMRLPFFPATLSSVPYDTPPTRVIPVLQLTEDKVPSTDNERGRVLPPTYVNPPNTDVERARAEARHAALELESTISQNSVTEMFHGSISPGSSEVFLPDFFPFDIHPDKPPPRPPKPPHLRFNPNLWDRHMIQVDLACPIYDIVPKPRPVVNLNPDIQRDKPHDSMSTNSDCKNKDAKNKNSSQRGPFLRSISANLEIPSRPNHQDSSATISISPNTRVSRPEGSSWSDYQSCLYDVPKPANSINESSTPSTEIAKGVVRRRRPPTPPSQNLKHTLFPLDIDGMLTADQSNKRRTSLTDGQIQPLTQKQRISICNEVNYLDLAFTADEGEYNPKPLTRETVYYSVDFIKTWAFNETRQNVEEFYRNT